MSNAWAARPTAAQRMAEQVQRVFDPAGAEQRRGVQDRAQLPGTEASVCSANATVRSSRVLSKLWVMSRIRKLNRVP